MQFFNCNIYICISKELFTRSQISLITIRYYYISIFIRKSVAHVTRKIKGFDVMIYKEAHEHKRQGVPLPLSLEHRHTTYINTYCKILEFSFNYYKYIIIFSSMLKIIIYQYLKNSKISIASSSNTIHDKN